MTRGCWGKWDVPTLHNGHENGHARIDLLLPSRSCALSGAPAQTGTYSHGGKYGLIIIMLCFERDPAISTINTYFTP